MKVREEARRRGLLLKALEERFQKYRYDPVAYIREVLGWEPWGGEEERPGQIEVLDAYTLALRQQHERKDFEEGLTAEEGLLYWKPGQIIKNRIRVESGHTTGKCVAFGSLITLANGQRVKAEDLIGQTFNLLTLVDGKPREVVARAEFNATEKVYEIVTDTGKKITRNVQHPLFTGAAIFRPGYRPIIKSKGFTPLSDIKPCDLIAVTEVLPAFGEEPLPEHQVKLLAYLLGDGGYTRNSIRFSQQEGKVLEEFKSCADAIGCCVEYIGQYDWILYGKERKKVKGANPAVNLLREVGMMQVHSRDKRVPDVVFRLPKELVRLFLNRLFATDGWASVANNGNREIGFCSASRGLIEDISHLLQRFGVHCRTNRKPKVNAWVLSIRDASDQMAFIEEIGIFGKEVGLEAVAERAAITRDRKQKQIALRPDRPRWWHKNAPDGTRWEKVVSVTALPEKCSTVAIEVPEHHTYLTEFWEHNTKLSSGIVNHFFDCFVPSIVYTFAPTARQIRDLLWKEIKVDRAGKELPGRVLETCEIKTLRADHFAKGIAANNNQGSGTERVQGQHNAYLMFDLDEAEGVADFVWDAIESMTSGGISIVLMTANPKTRTSKFYQQKRRSDVQNFRISCTHHPNVIHNREVVPNAVKREYVRNMVESHCEVVEEHSEDDHTFTLPFDVVTEEEGIHRAGTIFKPNPVFLWRVLGVAPANLSDNTFFPVGRYEAACSRRVAGKEVSRVRMGIDAAGYGADMGTLYVSQGMEVRREGQMSKLDSNQDPTDYWQKTRKAAFKAKERGGKSLHIRIDAGGGFGNGVYDLLNRDQDLREAYEDYQLNLVHFGGEPHDEDAYADMATNMYAEAAESIKGIAIVNAPELLEGDLCERQYKWVNRKGVWVRRLETKEEFRNRLTPKRSPDDGDGFVLCIAPDFLFGSAAAGSTLQSKQDWTTDADWNVDPWA